jgi:hypothetical protein
MAVLLAHYSFYRIVPLCKGAGSQSIPKLVPPSSQTHKTALDHLRISVSLAVGKLLLMWQTPDQCISTLFYSNGLGEHPVKILMVELEAIHDEVHSVLKNCKIVCSRDCHKDSRLGGLDWERYPQNLFPVRNGNH